MKLLCLLWFLPVAFGDTTVTCIYSKECLLPCISTHYDIIHWYKDKINMHSYYENRDQFDHQAPEYKGRTSLLPGSEIKKGNISLLLKDIRVQDEGRYKCYTADDATNDEKFVSVSVEARVKSVDISLKDDTVTCSTSGVYPEPDVYWSSSNSQENGPVESVPQTEENKLITLTSTFKVDFPDETYNYKCMIRSKQDTTKTLYTAILEQQAASELSENREFIFTCPVPKNIRYTLILSYSTSILKYDSDNSKPDISDQWKEKVTFHPENGTVKLSHLDDLGTYTCDITTAQSRHIMKATVRSRNVHIITIIAVISTLVIIIVGIALFVAYKRNLLPKCNGQEQMQSNETGSGSQHNENVSLRSENHKDENGT